MIKDILKVFNLKNIKKIEKIRHGIGSYNYLLQGDKEYVIKVLANLNGSDKRRLRIMINLLNFLNKENFPYEVPRPMLNKFEDYIFKYNNKYIWGYEKIKGKTLKNIDNEKIIEISKALAIFHKYSSKFKVNKEKCDLGFNWLVRKYKIMRERKVKNELDKLVKDNYDFFYNNLLKYKDKVLIKKDILVIHRDFKFDNLLFNNNKLTGIIDFGSIEVKPKVHDIAYSIGLNCLENNKININKVNLFLRTYERFNKISKIEKKLIFPLIMLKYVSFFWFDYLEAKNINYNKRIELIKGVIEKARDVEKYLSFNF